jgi:hypothetical protein
VIGLLACLLAGSQYVGLLAVVGWRAGWLVGGVGCCKRKMKKKKRHNKKWVAPRLLN